LAIKIKRQTIKAAIQLLKYGSLASLKVYFDCPKEVKSISSSVASVLVFPRIFVPWNMCTISPYTGGTLRRSIPEVKQSVLYRCTYFKRRSVGRR